MTMTRRAQSVFAANTHKKPTLLGRSLMVSALLAVSMAATIHAQDEENCGLWLGPSPIKEAEEHGWGHSIFTGKKIEKGTIVLGSGIFDAAKNEKVFGDLFIPVYDWEHLDMADYANHDDDSYLDDDSEIARVKAAELRAKNAPSEAELQEEPPLFHQLWNGDIYEKEVLESYESMRVFMPGLSNICPCTFDGFNLEQITSVNYRDWRDVKGDSHDETPPSPQAGSFAYLSNTMFVASRDILPGEELVVECADNSDDFDPSKYLRQKFTPKEAGGYSICLDDKVEERLADHTPNVAGGSYGGQRGLFAKRALKKDEILTSTPMVPVHRDEMQMDRTKYAELLLEAETHGKLDIPQKKQQLLLNYMYGHPDSSLLWLPQAPLMLSVNHASYDQEVEPNAKVQWHHDKYTEAQAKGKPLTRRQQFHHAELLEMDSRDVVMKHGMGLMIDLVALRDIAEGEEILIDYGKAWDDAMKQHKTTWESTITAIKTGHARDKAERKQQRKRRREENERQKKLDSPHTPKMTHKQKHIENSMTAIPLSSYVTANDYNELHLHDDLRTITEQRRKPYPSNLETACYFDIDWLDDSINLDEEADLVTYHSWYSQDEMFPDEIMCLLPCIITERRDFIEGEDMAYTDDDDDDDYMGDDDLRAARKEKTESRRGAYGGSSSVKRYTAKLVDTHEDNTSIPYDCHIYKRFEYFFVDVPREAVTFVNKPHSTDQWIDQAFRQPIGLPEEMVPKVWRDLSRAKGMRGTERRKKKVVVEKPPMTKHEEFEEKEYQLSLKKWNDSESRREKMDEIYEKKFFFSARADL